MPADFVAIAPQTGAKVSPAFDARGLDGLHVSADVLAGAEVVNILIVAGSTNKTLTDAAGTAIKLTNAVPSVYLQGGTFYVFDKTATVGACGVYVNMKAR